MAGAKFQGDLEERLKVILEYMAVPENNNILSIDEIHSIVSSGRTSSNLDISNLLKPMLTRGDIQCIGSTTYEEYYQYVEKDGTFTRRFSLAIFLFRTKPFRNLSNSSRNCSLSRNLLQIKN